MGVVRQVRMEDWVSGVGWVGIYGKSPGGS